MLISEKQDKEYGIKNDLSDNITNKYPNNEEHATKENQKSLDIRSNAPTTLMNNGDDPMTLDDTPILNNLSIFERPPGILMSTNRYRSSCKNVKFDEPQMELLDNLRHQQGPHHVEDYTKAGIALFDIRDPPNAILMPKRTHCLSMKPGPTDDQPGKHDTPGENGHKSTEQTKDHTTEWNKEEMTAAGDTETNKHTTNENKNSEKEDGSYHNKEPRMDTRTTPEIDPGMNKPQLKHKNEQKQMAPEIGTPNFCNPKAGIVIYQDSTGDPSSQKGETSDFSKPKARTVIFPQLTDKGYYEYFPKKVHLPAYAMNIDVTEARLPFLPTWIGNPLTKETETTSLLDSGASYCFCSENKLKTLEDYTQYIKGYQNIDIQTGCDQVVSTKATIAELPLTFKDDLGNEHTILVLFIFVNILSQEIFLGADFLFLNDYFTYFSKSHLMFNDILTESMVRIPVTWRRTAPSAKLLTYVGINYHGGTMSKLITLVVPNLNQCVFHFIGKISMV